VWLWTPLVLALCHAHAIASVQIVNILVDPIKGSLGVSDTQYSLLQGASLGLLAVVLGVPIARIADTGRRRNVIALGAIAWSTGSLLCAAAQTFTHLLIARALVGIGEIVLFPAALSIIYDSAPRERLATAIGIFGAGGPIGAAAALLGGGWLASAPLGFGGANIEGWRWAFGLCAVSGILVAGATLSLTEPARVWRDAHDRPAPLLLFLRANLSLFLCVSAGFILISIAVLAVNAWTPTFLVRVHQFTYEAAGQLTGLAALACAAAGTWVAGVAIDACERNERRDGAILVACLVAGLLTVAVIVAVGSNSLAGVSASVCAAYFLLGMPTVIGGTALQQISPAHLRAQILAVHVLLVNLIAMPAGPTGVALLTDHAFGSPAALGRSLVIIVSIAVTAAIAVMLLARSSFIARRAQQSATPCT
jgi:MFS family permease